MDVRGGTIFFSSWSQNRIFIIWNFNDLDWFWNWTLLNVLRRQTYPLIKYQDSVSLLSSFIFEELLLEEN